MGALDDLLISKPEKISALDSLLASKPEPKEGFLDSLLKSNDLSPEEHSLYEKATGKKLIKTSTGYGVIDPEEIKKFEEHPFKESLKALPEALAGFILPTARAEQSADQIRKQIRQFRPEPTMAAGLKSELKNLPEDVFVGAATFPGQGIAHPLETLQGIGHGFAALKHPVEAAKKGELIGDLIGDVGILYGLKEGYLNIRYPELSDRIARAGFKDIHEAVQTLDKNPSDERFNELNERDLTQVHRVLRGLQDSMVSPGETPLMLEAPLPHLALPAPETVYGHGFEMGPSPEEKPQAVIPETVKPKANLRLGRASKVVMPGKFDLPTKLAIVDLDSLGKRAEETQMRDRERNALRAQEEEMFQKFEPSFLADSTMAGHGAPVVTQDLRPLTAAGRINTLDRIFTEGSDKANINLDRYRKEVLYDAKSHGINITPKEIEKMNKPALVRVLQKKLTPEEEMQFAKMADAKEKASFSSVEQSLSESGLVTHDMVKELKVSPQGRYIYASNREAIDSFLSKLPIEDQNELRDPKGTPTLEAEKRFKGAVLGALLKDKHALARVLENPDPNIQRAVRMIEAAAPDLLSLENKSPQRSLAPEISEALRELSILREKGEKVFDFLKQEKMFPDSDKDAMVKGIIHLFDQSSLERGLEALKGYAKASFTEDDPNLMGETPRSKMEMAKGYFPWSPGELGGIRFPFGKEDPVERNARIRKKLDDEIMEKLKPSAEAAKIIEERREKRAGPGGYIPKKVKEELMKNKEALQKENEEYQKDIKSDPQLILKDETGKPIMNLNDHPLVKIDPIEKASMPHDIMGAGLMTGDSLTILGRQIPMELVRTDRKIIPRAVRILNGITTKIDDMRFLAKRLSKDELSDVSLALENLKRDDSGNIVKSKTVQNEMRKDPVKGKILEEFEKGYAWARTKQGFDAPMIQGQQGYMHHAFEQVGIKLDDVRNGRAIGDDTTTKTLDLDEQWRKMRAGQPGWILDPFAAWDIYVKQGMRKKYLAKALERTDAMANDLFKEQPYRMKYYKNLKDTALAKPYGVDQFLKSLSPPSWAGGNFINVLKGSDVVAAAQYIGTIGMNLATMVKHFSPIAYTAAEHPIYTLRAAAVMARELYRMAPQNWIRGEFFLDRKASPVLRNPLIYQSVENFYNMAGSAITKAPKAFQQLMFSPITFAEYLKRGLNFHAGLMMELDKGAPLKTAYARATQFALERGLPMGKLLRNEYVRNFVPRAGLMFTQPPAATLNMLYRMSRENKPGLLKIATVMGGILYFQTVANNDNVIDEMGLFGKKTLTEGQAKLDVFARYSPIAQAMEIIHPSMTTVEFVQIMDGLRKAKTSKQRKDILDRAGLWGAQLAGVPIPPMAIESGGKLGMGSFIPMGPHDIAQFMKLNADMDKDPNELLLELFRVKTRPRYWFH